MEGFVKSDQFVDCYGVRGAVYRTLFGSDVRAKSLGRYLGRALVS